MNTLRSNSIARNLLMTASRLENYANHCLFNPQELTFSGMKILHILHFKGPMLPTEIIKIVGGSKSNITQRLNLLAKRGLIDRYLPNNITDKRNVMVKLTKPGAVKIAQVVALINQKSLDLASCFSANEITAFSKFMDKLNAIINEEEKKLNIKPTKLCE
jgi:DNA-binding MarR family transcriptional regulator